MVKAPRTWWMAGAGLVGAGLPPPDPPAPERTTEPTPGRPTRGGGWQKINSSGSADLFYAAPDGSGFLLWDEHDPLGPGMYAVRTADLSAEVVEMRRTRVTVNGWDLMPQVAVTPYGPMLAPGTPGARWTLPGPGTAGALGRGPGDRRGAAGRL